ncbi:MAG: NYN domain-containing protein [candidate division Zixibacteria bacterium]|nr:NYN domain-containing protein [candidate division Zixibacteria bacterium]
MLFGKPIAILVDGAFFLKRYRKCFYDGKNHDPKTVAKNMYTMLMRHVEDEELYRILYYDCPPLSKKAHNPITGKAIDFAKSDVASFRYEFYRELVKLRKVALRLGELKDKGNWLIRPLITKELLKNKIQIKDLTEFDVFFDINQKGVDIRIGLDIASLSYKRLVSRIILVSGDSDFVPAAKLARREGIDVILDPMWQKVDDKLFEHIDGLKSTCERPK